MFIVEEGYILIPFLIQKNTQNGVILILTL